MKMNNERNKERFESAESKLGTNVKVQEELAKPEWQERYKSIVKEIHAASSTKELEAAIKKLQDNFDSIFELITAPGVDEFINWANDLTDNKNEKNTNKLRKFLVENFTTYDNDIEKVNANKGCLEVNDNSIFAGLLKGFRKKIKEIVNKFLSKPDEFVNNISSLFNTLSKEFEGINGIDELKYTDKIKLIPADQQQNSVSLAYFDSLFDTILKQNQDLSHPEKLSGKATGSISGNQSEKVFDNQYEIISARINNVKASFELLLSSGIAEETDERLKGIFRKLEDDMIDTKGDVRAHIESFLDKKWVTIKDNFFIIKRFEESDRLEFDPDGWKSFEKASTINAVIEDYNNLKNDKGLAEVERSSKDKVESLLKGRAKKISDLKDKVSGCRTEILEVFKKIVEAYSNNDKKEMLTRIIESNPSLQHGFDEIYGEENGALSTITNGIKTLSAEGYDFLTALSDGTVTTMIEEGNNIKDKFLDTIKASGLENAINWLESITDLNLSKLNDFIEPLLERGLITINIQKEF